MMPPGDDPARQWRKSVYTHARLVNAYVAKGMRSDWVDVGPEPQFRCFDGAGRAAVDAVREANRLGQLDGLKEQWPPAYEPLTDLITDNGQAITMVTILDDGTILARIGAPWEAGRIVHIVGDTVADVPGMEAFGRCPARRYFAVATDQGVVVTDGWGGARVCVLPWPTGQEGVPDGFGTATLSEPPQRTQLTPFPDGTRALLVCSDGVFVLTATGARRLLPTEDVLREHFAWLSKEYPDDPLTCHIDMEHGAVSADGSLIAVGAQDGRHLVFDSDLALVGQIGPHSEYPHFAVFSQDGTTVAVNACHFYNGVTIGVPTRLVAGWDTEPYQEDERITVLEQGARVYAAVSRGDEFILGDAYGYVRAVGTDGSQRWQHFVGGTISGMDISPDGQRLAVATYAGWLSIIALDAEGRPPYQIGDGGHVEQRRWLFWRNEPAPLIW